MTFFVPFSPLSIPSIRMYLERPSISQQLSLVVVAPQLQLKDIAELIVRLPLSAFSVTDRRLYIHV